MNDWKSVATALLGSWPNQVAAWGREGLAAYISELQARGMTPEAALVAIRSCPAGQKFPPSAPELAALARRDPSVPTVAELMAQLYEAGGVFGFKRSGVTISPWVLKFAEDKSAWLRGLPIDDPVEGKWARKDIERAWDAFLSVNAEREVAEIATRSARGTLGRVDALAAIEQIGGGS